MGIVEGREDIKNVVYLADAVVDDAPREGDVANGCAKKQESSVGGARDVSNSLLSGKSRSMRKAGRLEGRRLDHDVFLFWPRRFFSV